MSNTDLHPEVFFCDFWINVGCIVGAFGMVFWSQNALKQYVFFECILHAVWLEGWRHPGGKYHGRCTVTPGFLGYGGGYRRGKLRTLITDNNQ